MATKFSLKKDRFNPQMLGVLLAESPQLSICLRAVQEFSKVTTATVGPSAY